jgi:hypothetical protein
MPMGFPVALPLGGGPDDLDVAQAALLEAMRDYLVPNDAAQLALTNGEALAIAMTWAINRRRKGQLNPNAMIETLPAWEEACGLRPGPNDTDYDRRKALAAQFLGYIGNALTQLYALCQSIAGASFLGFYLPTSSAPTYTPGLMPGPPGWESMSCRAMVAVRLAPVGATGASFLAMVQKLNRALGLACPAWMGWVVGIDQGHTICDVAIADAVLVMD